MSEYKVNSIIKGQVTGIEKYGIFINIDPYYNGLVHISEISDGYVKDVNDYVNIGDTIYCKILEIDEDNLQIKLSIKGFDYKTNKKHKSIIESNNGFNPLKENLSLWMEKKLKEIRSKS